MTQSGTTARVDYPGIARALTWRYVIALSLVATLSTAAWISLHLVISEQKNTAAVVNVSGRQRMLSQRTAMFLNLLLNTPKAEKSLIRGKMKDAIDLMTVGVNPAEDKKRFFVTDKGITLITPEMLGQDVHGSGSHSVSRTG